MTKPQIKRGQNGFTTAEMVVYPMIVITLLGVAFGFYHNSKIEDAVAAAVDLGLEQQAVIEEYFDLYGEMPQSQADINLTSVIPQGILIGMDYQAGELGVPAADKYRISTLRALVDMKEFGTRFEDIESGYLLIARVQGRRYHRMGLHRRPGLGRRPWQALLARDLQEAAKMAKTRVRT